MSSLTQSIRSSCKHFTEKNSSIIYIDQCALKRFALTINKDDILKTREWISLPLSFPTDEDEMNFICTLNLLNFGSGYRKELHQANGRGAFHTIQYGLLGLHITGKTLDTKYFNNTTIHQIGELFSIPLDHDEEISLGVYMSKPGPLKPLAADIVRVMKQTGNILSSLGFNDFASFIKAKSEANNYNASKLVKELVNHFPAFKDQVNISGLDIGFHKKAQLLVCELNRRNFDSLSLSGLEELTIFADNVVPCVLRVAEILKCSDPIVKSIENDKELGYGTIEESLLRASAIVASEQLAKEVGCMEWELDLYLWTKGKDEMYRKVNRHNTKTIFY